MKIRNLKCDHCVSDYLNSDELLLPGQLQFFESHHLISMVSKLHRERQD